MTRSEMETTIRAARSALLAAWNGCTDSACKALTDDAYKKLSLVLREL